MLTNSKHAVWVVMCSLIALPALSSPAMAKRCTGLTVMMTGSVDELCECKRVTPGFVAQLQRRSDFVRILEETSQSCQSLAVALTEVTTFSTSGPTEHYAGEGPGEDGPGSDNGPGNEGPGGTGSGGGPGAGVTN